MQLKTTISPVKDSLSIEHQDKILTIGSCFAENIAEKLNFYKFDILSNPFGVLYNPVSIYNSIKAVSEKKVFSEDDLFFDQTEWHSFYHHSNFSFHNSEVVLKNINEGIQLTEKAIKNSNIIIITLGTSYVYKFIEAGFVVSNCHKLPQNLFEHYMIGMYEAREFIQATIELLREMNPEIKTLFTLSPVRHWKDGATENQLSKAILLLAIQEIVNEDEQIFYFPSYEIMIDDLRDYRFYARDLVHPNDIAIDYIWEVFSESYFTEECKAIIRETGKIATARKHKSRNVFSEQHRKFLRTQLDAIHSLENNYSHINLSDDKKYFESQLETGS